MCIATAADGLPATVTSYEWINTLCYNNLPVWPVSCFYDGRQRGYNVTGNNLLAGDHGRVLCSVTISGSPHNSDLIILHITGRMTKHCIQSCNYIN